MSIGAVIQGRLILHKSDVPSGAARIRSLMILAAMILFVVPATASADARVHAASTCSDYSTQADAQRAADTRDPDGDGVYCESLPCPCLKPGQGSPAPAPRARKKKRAQVFGARITRVVDGDTVKVRYGSRRATVRIIGIDTPETHRPGVSIECGGPQASASMKRLAPVGARVVLRTDPTQDTRDRYGRLLAYVGRGERDLGRTQISRGWAKTYVYGGKPFQRTSAYKRSQAKARGAGRGVYGLCGGDFHSEATSTAARARTQITAMRMKLRGHNPGADYYVEVALRLRVCGRRGRVAFHITETGSPPGRDAPVFRRSRSTVHQDQHGRCDTHRITYTLADKFFGISRYRVAVRARTSARGWSAIRSRHEDTLD